MLILITISVVAVALYWNPEIKDNPLFIALSFVATAVQFLYLLYQVSKDLKKQSTTIPHQIPPPPVDFTGRREEVKHLLKHFHLGATITGLRGMGGIGKTALALVLADRLKPRFPDGQLFLDMQGTNKRHLTPEEAMAQVIRAYFPGKKLPESKSEIAGLYHSVLSGKKALILLDNAADCQQIEPLLPPSSCAVIITSRDKFALPGLEEKDLDVLPLEDAKELLLMIAKRIGNQTEDLARLCGCLPIALRNAAHTLAERKTMGVDEYLNRLKEAKKRLELVEASLSLSYDLLAPKLQGLWCMLSVFPADFDRAGAEAVWKMDSDSAIEALSDLFKLSLVEYQEAADRYHLHDLARDFAASRLEAGVKAEAQQRHAEHYRNVLSGSDHLYEQGGENVMSALSLFDCERSNIQAGQGWAAANFANSDANARTCSDFALAWDILSLRLHPREFAKWLNAALLAARKIENRKSECIHLLDLGIACSDLGNARKAIEYYEKALAIAQENRYRRYEGKVLNMLGSAYGDQGYAQKAIEYYKKALAIDREIGNRLSEGRVLGNLGNAYSHQGETSKAIEYHEQSLKISHEIDRRGEGIDLNNLGNDYLDIDKISKAIEYYKQALKISSEIGDRDNEGTASWNMSLALDRLGERKKAIEYAKAALKILEEIKDPRVEKVRLKLEEWMR